MDRDTRILYRQRGSNLRKTIDEDNILVIRTPMKLVENPSLDTHTSIPNSLKRSRDEPEDIPYEPQFGVQEDNASVGQPMLSPLLSDAPRYNEGRNEPRSKYQRLNTVTVTDFSNIRITELKLSESKIRCYDVLKDLVQFLFKDNLMKKANMDSIKYANDEIQSMMYKLDFKIFDKIVNGIINDLNDIKDINLANNILLNNLLRLQKRRQKLNMELISTRTQLTQLMTNEEFWYQNKTDQLHLNDVLKLNQGLKQLSKRVSTTSPRDTPATTGATATMQDNLPCVIHLLDPQHGILSKITNINNELRKQYM